MSKLVITSSKAPEEVYRRNLNRNTDMVYSRFIKPLDYDNLKIVESEEVHKNIKPQNFDPRGWNKTIIAIINKNDNFISIKQRGDAECGYYALLSVFFSLIKNKFGRVASNFVDLFIGKASSIGIQSSSNGVGGKYLSNLVNKYFFDNEKVCSFEERNSIKPRITMMYTHGHWVGQIKQRQSSILLEPYSGKIMKVNNNLLKEAEENMKSHFKIKRKLEIAPDLSVYVNKEKLFKYYKSFLKM